MLKITKKNNYFEISDVSNNILILAKKYKLGANVYIGERTKICNNDGSPMESLIIGDNVQIHHDSTIMVPAFSVLDYTKIHNNFYAYGANDLEIGYNCWFGSASIVDTLGGLRIHNNVGVGSHSQIYSHAKFGDTLYGCKMNSYKKVELLDDVWITPNCTITMASMAKKSMLLAGSVLTKDTQENHVYAGVPAKDITEKLGTQFDEKINQKKIYEKLNKYLEEFYLKYPDTKKGLLKICMQLPKKRKKNVSYFIIDDRRYIKQKTNEETAFINFLLPDKGKFIPY